MNEQLKFSWGHIIAFLAIIIISYFSFVGVTYWTNGDFTIAGLSMVIIDILLYLFFIGSQILKATDRKFSKRIWWERILVFLSPITFIVLMLPYFHFWVVNSQNDEIVDDFNNAIGASKQMFENYESYSNDRIDNYDAMLERVISNRYANSVEFSQCGFTPGKEDIQKENMITTLRLQLLSENYYSLKKEAIQWIDNSNKGASTFNVFLLGNTKQIKSAIENWHEQLEKFSSKELSNENFDGYNEVSKFDKECESLDDVDNYLNNLTYNFTKSEFPNIKSIIIAILLYLSMLLPYCLQDRHTKSTYQLFLHKKRVDDNNSIIAPQPYSEEKKIDNNSDEDDFNIGISTTSEIDDDYNSFTL